MDSPPRTWWFAIRMMPVIVLLLAWEYAAATKKSVAFFYGRPTQIVSSLVSDTFNAGFINDIFITFSAAIIGFLLGTAGGLAISLCISLSRLVSYVALPYIVFLGGIPIVAIAPLMILWFGAGYNTSLAVATLSTIILSIGQVHDGLKATLTEWERLAASFRSTKWRFYRHIVLPGAMTWVFSSWRAAIGLALIGAFVGEFISSDRGLGRYILKASALYDSSRVLGGIIVIGLGSLALTGLLHIVERRLAPWRRSAESDRTN